MSVKCSLPDKYHYPYYTAVFDCRYSIDEDFMRLREITGDTPTIVTVDDPNLPFTITCVVASLNRVNEVVFSDEHIAYRNNLSLSVDYSYQPNGNILVSFDDMGYTYEVNDLTTAVDTAQERLSKHLLEEMADRYDLFEYFRAARLSTCRDGLKVVPTKGTTIAIRAHMMSLFLSQERRGIYEVQTVFRRAVK